MKYKRKSDDTKVESLRCEARADKDELISN